jgi:hypothetical protein
MKPEEKVEIPDLTIVGLNGTREQTYICTRCDGNKRRFFGETRTNTVEGGQKIREEAIKSGRKPKDLIVVRVTYTLIEREGGG